MKKKTEKETRRSLSSCFANEPAKPRDPPKNGEKNTDLPLIYGYPPRDVHHVQRRERQHDLRVYARARPPGGQDMSGSRRSSSSPEVSHGESRATFPPIRSGSDLAN